MKLVRLGMVGVDSASLLITDPMYLGSWDHDDPFSVTEDLNDAHRHPCPPDLPYSFGGATAAHCSADHGGVLGAFPQAQDVGAGIAVATGYGDGAYEVFAEVTEEGDLDPDMRAFGVGRVARVIIDFGVVERQDLVRRVIRRSSVDDEVRRRALGEGDG